MKYECKIFVHAHESCVGSLTELFGDEIMNRRIGDIVSVTGEGFSSDVDAGGVLPSASIDVCYSGEKAGFTAEHIPFSDSEKRNYFNSVLDRVERDVEASD